MAMSFNTDPYADMARMRHEMEREMRREKERMHREYQEMNDYAYKANVAAEKVAVPTKPSYLNQKLLLVKG